MLEQDRYAERNPEQMSVSARILLRLYQRLMDIRGQGGMVNNLEGRVIMRRPVFDGDIDKAPAIFIRRRINAGNVAQAISNESDRYAFQVIYDCIGIVPADDDSTFSGEGLLADMHRAIEIPGEECLPFENEDGRRINLLSEELAIVDLQYDDAIAVLPFDVVGFGVLCSHVQKYGAPNHVDP